MRQDEIVGKCEVCGEFPVYVTKRTVGKGMNLCHSCRLNQMEKSIATMQEEIKGSRGGEPSLYTIPHLIEEVYKDAKEKGFHEDGLNIPKLLMLIVGECGEALEADRNRKYTPSKLLQTCIIDTATFEEKVKDTFEDELADIVIRVFDLCAVCGIDLESHIIEKMKYNKTRPYKHGKAY